MLCCAVSLVFADDKWAPYAGCPIEHSTYHPKYINQSFSLSEDASTNSLMFSAGKIHSNNSAIIRLEDSAYLRKGELEILSDHMQYHRHLGTGKMTSSYMTYQGLRLWSNSVLLQGNQDMIHSHAVFSRCEGGFEDLAWQVDANEVKYHHEDESVTLYSSILRFYDVPVFYIPWTNIPLTRRSGLLFPKFGQKTFQAYDTSGYFYSQPVYVNLGQNMDMTHTFSHLENRSLLLSNQFRYLAPWIDLEVNHDWMQKDSILPQIDSSVGDYRRVLVHAHSQLSSYWRLSGQWLDLSVRPFHDLFPESILERPLKGSFNRQIKLESQHLGNHQWRAFIAQNLSLKRAEEDSYLELPHLSYGYHRTLSPNQTLRLGISGVRLQSPDNRNLRNYQYTQARPIWQWEQYGGFYQNYAEFGFYQGIYQIDNFIDNRGIFDASKEVNYQSGYAKLGGELYFNNTQVWYPSSLSSKLSPVLYYLYSPYRDPESIPFASYSAKKIDAFRSLLNVHRYTRDDFIGESNRVVSGISQTFFTSKWQLRTTLGKNTDLETPTTDTALPVFDQAFSHWFLELAYNYGFLRANVNTQWQELTDDSPIRIFSQIYYEDSQQNVMRVNYSRHSQQEGVQNLDNTVTELAGVGASYRWGAWRLAYQTDYRLTDNRINSYLLGAIYDSCCWQVSTTIDGQSSIEDVSQLQYTINLGFTFKGLVGIGPGQGTEERVYKAVTANR